MWWPLLASGHYSAHGPFTTPSPSLHQHFCHDGGDDDGGDDDVGDDDGDDDDDDYDDYDGIDVEDAPGLAAASMDASLPSCHFTSMSFLCC